MQIEQDIYVSASLANSSDPLVGVEYLARFVELFDFDSAIDPRSLRPVPSKTDRGDGLFVGRVNIELKTVFALVERNHASGQRKVASARVQLLNRQNSALLARLYHAVGVGKVCFFQLIGKPTASRNDDWFATSQQLTQNSCSARVVGMAIVEQ